MFLECEDPSLTDRLGGEVVLKPDTTIPQLGGLLETHRQGLVEVAGDVQRLNERIERMAPQTQALLDQQKRQVAAEWVPGGDVSLLDARYLLPDGAVRLGRTTTKQLSFDGTTEDDVQTEGLLTDPHPCTREQADVQRAFLAFRLAFVRAQATKTIPSADPLCRGAYALFRKHLTRLPGRVGEFCLRMVTDPAVFKRVISNVSGTGGEMIPTPTINEIHRPVRLERRVASLVRRVPASTPSFSPVIVTGRALPVRRGATSDDPTRYPVATFTTANTTVTMVDQVLQVLLDPQWVSDAGKLFDAMGEVSAFMDQGWADGYELAYLHGDTANTHQDTIATWTMNSYFSSGQLDGTGAATRFWIGFRGRAFDDSTSESGGGTWDATDHFGALSLLGNWAVGAIAITGLACLYEQLLSNSNFLTVDKMGPRATLLTGQLGTIGDTPLIISEFMPKVFSTSDGTYTGSNLGNEIVYVNPEAYVYYELDGGASWDQLYPDRGARYVGETRRGLLHCKALSGEKPCAVEYNL